MFVRSFARLSDSCSGFEFRLWKIMPGSKVVIMYWTLNVIAYTMINEQCVRNTRYLFIACCKYFILFPGFILVFGHNNRELVYNWPLPSLLYSNTQSSHKQWSIPSHLQHVFASTWFFMSLLYGWMDGIIFFSNIIILCILV